ncbi:MAG: ACP S-malonyltransferase [Caulobacteraceae bacterium]
MLNNNSDNLNVALLFPGVGSQYYGMGKEFFNNFRVVKSTFEEASDTLGINFADICFNAEKDRRLEQLEYIKPALVFVSVATYRLYMEEIGIAPKFNTGYSLGEYTALCCAGAISFADTLKVVRQRALIINEASSGIDGTMAWVVGIDYNIVEELCREIRANGKEVYLSAYNSQQRMSISGPNSTIRAIAEKIEDAGGVVIPIKMSGPFHSPMMFKASDNLREVLSKYEFKTPVTTVIANRNALPYESSSESMIDNLSLQIVEPIRWTSCIEYLLLNGIDKAIEMGPKMVLKYLVELNTNKIKTFSLETSSDLEVLKTGLGCS